MDSSSVTVLQENADSVKDVFTLRFAIAILLAVLGMLQFGYNTSVINAPQALIEAFYNGTYFERYGAPMDESTINLLWGFTVSITAIGGMVGAVIGAWWSDRFGRKGGMMVNSAFGIVAGIMMGFSKLASSYELLIIGRLVVGFNCGLYTGLVPMYISEVAPRSIRGAMGTLNQLAVTVGMLIGQVFGLTEVLGTDTLWPVLLGIAAVPPLIQLITLPFIPESPRYLLLTKGQQGSAEQALLKLRNKGEVKSEIDEMYREQEMCAEQGQNFGVWQVLSSRTLRLPLIVSIVMHLSQQFSGINCIFYYSVTLFQSIGLSEDDAKYANLGVGGVMVVMTLVSIPLMDRAGRKTLHLLGLTGMCAVSVIFTVAYHYAIKTSQEWLQWASIVSALIIVVFFAIGPGSIPWLIVAELFSQGPRPVAVNIGVLVNWLGNFVVGQSFPPLQSALEEFVFLPYTFLLVFFVIWLFIYLPETKGKTFYEATDLFKSAHDDKDTRITHM